MKLLKDLENTLSEGKITFNDIEDLEEIVTPGSGFGCNCNNEPAKTIASK